MFTRNYFGLKIIAVSPTQGEKHSWFQSHLTLHKTDIQTERVSSFSEALWEKKGEECRTTHEEKKVLLV